MGIYDREYYRSESRFMDAFALRGQTTKWLIIVNVIVFIIQMMTDPHRPNDYGGFTDLFDLDTDAVLHGQVWRLLSCAFLHDPRTWTHIFFNMWGLWMFGGDLEDIYGRWEFLAFYLMAAVVSSFVFFIDQLIGEHGRVFGASGAVTAVMVLCACHFPRRTVLLFFVLPVPIWALAVFLVAQDMYGQLSGADAVAFSAHLGGAGFGFLYYKQQWRVLNWFSGLRSLRVPRAKPRLRIYTEDAKTREPVSVPATTAAELDEQLEAKVDAVLEKVARHGQHSLTDAEKQLLMRASEIYKKRRT